MCEVVGAQDLTQSFDRQRVSTAAVAENMAASTRPFNLSVFPSCNSRAAAADHRDAVAVCESRSETGITIAPDGDFCFSPNRLAYCFQLSPIIDRFAAGKKDTNTRCVTGQSAKHISQVFFADQYEICGGKLAAIDHLWSTVRSTNKNPVGFRAAAFGAEDEILIDIAHFKPSRTGEYFAVCSTTRR